METVKNITKFDMNWPIFYRVMPTRNQSMCNINKEQAVF